MAKEVGTYLSLLLRYLYCRRWSVDHHVLGLSMALTTFEQTDGKRRKRRVPIHVVDGSPVQIFMRNRILGSQSRRDTTLLSYKIY